MDTVGPIQYHSQRFKVALMEQTEGKESGELGTKALSSCHCHCELQELDSIKL